MVCHPSTRCVAARSSGCSIRFVYSTPYSRSALREHFSLSYQALARRLALPGLPQVDSGSASPDRLSIASLLKDYRPRGFRRCTLLLKRTASWALISCQAGEVHSLLASHERMATQSLVDSPLGSRRPTPRWNSQDVQFDQFLRKNAKRLLFSQTGRIDLSEEEKAFRHVLIAIPPERTGIPRFQTGFRITHKRKNMQCRFKSVEAVLFLKHPKQLDTQ